MNSSFYNIVMEEMNKPFCYGKHDCALFCASVYQRAFGVDLADGIRGSYDDHYHAVRTIVRLGGWENILLARGFKKIHKNYTNVGDVVTSEGALGIYIGNCKAVFAGGAFRTIDKIENSYTLCRN